MTEPCGLPKVAIGSQLKHCPQITTLGVCPNLSHYPQWKLQLILDSKKIFFPTSLYAEMFSAMGKEIFPSIESYRFVGDKIKQTIMFQLVGLPVPRTRFYYGPVQQQNISRDFSFPFIAKTPRYSSRGNGVWLVKNREELSSYLESNQPAYIQEFLPRIRDFRIVVAGEKIIHSYQRIPQEDDFRANVSLGATLCFEDIPEQAENLALTACHLCGFNYTGMDICESEGKFYVLEANMKFGTQGFKAAGLDLKKILCRLVREDHI
ncbi:ATP-grasp domain-containing protein [Desulfonatronovibrio hydrogenovorans]|uniref:ATP-grasp domain-containing protein n=1 Tax=Desulfonatronovibrio hydrogenovorans TaxID=53245 RepID=UPI00048D9CA7|nr:ATP-grasp domain-containing protein [Desulfonatronovibrio hydrogenovorans]